MGALRSIHCPMNIKQSFEDIRKYLLDEFARIHREHRGTMAMILSPWPTPEVVDNLVENSSGYFIYASTVIKFIDDKNSRPTERLKFITGLKESDSGSPFGTLDQLYIQILSQAHARPQFLKILAVLTANFTLSTDEMEQLLELEPGDVPLALRSLHSVIDLPWWKDSPLLFHHASFRDFLQDPARAGIFYVGGCSMHRTDLSRKMLKAFSYKHDNPSLNQRGPISRYDLFQLNLFKLGANELLFLGPLTCMMCSNASLPLNHLQTW